MKNNITIQTLSQIHVGSGVFLQKGNDFIVDDNKGNSDIYVIDPNKLGDIIGTSQATINEWVVFIERGKAQEFIQARTRGHLPKEFAKRRIANYANFQGTQGTLKECLHDGMGRPYIPGSSIKGAIRTAVLSTLAKKKGDGALISMFKKAFAEADYRKRDKVLANIEKTFLGNNPNADLFRFLTVSDAFFDKGSEIAIKQINLNVTHKESLKDTRMQQIVEAIASDEKSSCSIKIDKERFQKVWNFHHQDLKNLPPMPDEMSDITTLFALINQHTKKLVEDEIKIWSDDYADYHGQSDYIASMEEILDAITSCESNQCVLRLGQAIGWRFITGAWTENLPDDLFYGIIVPLARPKNNQRYSEYDFPKSRRLDDESYLFGFLKLTIGE